MQFFSNIRNSSGSSLKGLFLRVPYCTSRGSFQTVIAQIWQRTIGRFSLFLWKFFCMSYMSHRSHSPGNLCLRGNMRVLWYDMWFPFFSGFYSWHSTVTPKQNGFASVSCKISKGVQRMTSSLTPLETRNLPCLLGYCWHFLTDSKYRGLFHKLSGPKKFFLKWMADET